MIEQRGTQLLISFPTEQAASQARQWMEMAVIPWLPMVSQQQQPPVASSEPPSGQQRSNHVLLTDDRLEQLSNQRAQGLTAHQRLLRAQSTLRDGVLPFSKPGQQAPQPTNQPSPRMRAQQEGGFADGESKATALRSAVPADGGVQRKTKLRPAPAPSSPPPSKS